MWWHMLFKHPEDTFLIKDWGQWVYKYDTEYEMDFGDIDFSMLNMGGGEGLDFDAAGNDDDDGSDIGKEVYFCSDFDSDSEEIVTFTSDDDSDTKKEVAAEA
ncbi:hypothetical protein Fmac_016210 [Flemingia macrophylla]|uniref:Uncharacterized protein n=1 Tax=Flemingia macrophylla TaxID=520843 RepID=A0ABD1MHG4_9FABA